MDIVAHLHVLRSVLLRGVSSSSWPFTEVHPQASPNMVTDQQQNRQGSTPSWIEPPTFSMKEPACQNTSRILPSTNSSSAAFSVWVRASKRGHGQKISRRGTVELLQALASSGERESRLPSGGTVVTGYYEKRLTFSKGLREGHRGHQPALRDCAPRGGRVSLATALGQPGRCGQGITTKITNTTTTTATTATTTTSTSTSTGSKKNNNKTNNNNKNSDTDEILAIS